MLLCLYKSQWVTFTSPHIPLGHLRYALLHNFHVTSYTITSTHGAAWSHVTVVIQLPINQAALWAANKAGCPLLRTDLTDKSFCMENAADFPHSTNYLQKCKTTLLLIPCFCVCLMIPSLCQWYTNTHTHIYIFCIFIYSGSAWIQSWMVMMTEQMKIAWDDMARINKKQTLVVNVVDQALHSVRKSATCIRT